MCTFIYRRFISLFYSIIIQGNWPGDFKQQAKGHCACEYGYEFDPDEGECEIEDSLWETGAKVAVWIIILIVVMLIVGLGCCVTIIWCICSHAR